VADRRDGPTRLRSLPKLDLTPIFRRVPYAIHRAAEIIEGLPQVQHNAVAAELRALARRPGETLTRSAVQALAAAGFEIGFHTRRHHLLTTLDAPALEAAMNEGRAEIEAVIGQRLRMIAYPHGKANRRVAEVARSTGYECAFTASPNPVGPSTDPLMIGRVEVPPAPLGTFVRIIVSALRANGT